MSTFQPQASLPLLKRLYFQFVHRHFWVVVGAFILMAIESGLITWQAYLLEPTINKIFVAKEKSSLIWLAQLILLVFVLRGLINWAHTVVMARVGQTVVADVQRTVLASALQQDVAFFQANSSGQLTSVIINDVGAMRFAMVEGIIGAGKNIMTLIGLVGLMFYQNLTLSVLCFVVFPISSFAVLKIGKKLRRLAGGTQMQVGSLNSALGQAFQGIRQVKAYQGEGHEQARAGAIISAIEKLSIKTVRVATLSTPLSEFLSGVAIVLIILVGGGQVVAGTATAGDFFSFITAFFLAYEPLKRLAKLNSTVQIGLAAAERVLHLADERPQIINGTRQVDAAHFVPAIAFEQVGFTYPDGTMALHNIDLQIAPGQKVALVGHSGSGKSTMLQLLLRFYDVTQGHIMVAGHDLRDYDLASLRPQMALVSQDVFIFDDTVTANIAYGVPHSTQEQVEKAAHAAAAHEFVMQLEHGYNTRLGEFGTKLSGGQKQRIAIARALLRQAPILLLDEATSALDNESEAKVVAALQTLQQGRTTIVVAHRLSTVQNADMLVVMEKGHIVETGSHTELLANGRVYPQLYQSLAHDAEEGEGTT